MASRSASTIHSSTSSRSSPHHPEVPHPQPVHHQRRTTTSKPLNFQQAMNDFKGMFPEIDRDVIETVLRANNGVVQTTIDQLLELQESAIAEQAADDATDFGHTLPSYEASIGGGEEPPPAYSDIWEDVPAPEPEPVSYTQPPPAPVVENNCNGISSRARARNQFWGAPRVGKLPNDFLRIGSEYFPSQDVPSNNTDNKAVAFDKKYKRRTFSSEDFMADEDIERFLEDEKLAHFLQNEEFLRELRRNREFVNSLEADHRQAMEASGTPVTSSPVITGGARPRTTPTQEDAQFKQKLRHMGKSTKKKFGKIAKKFSRNKATTARPMQPSESRFNLLDEEEADDNRSNEGLYNLDEEDEHSLFQRDFDTTTPHNFSSIGSNNGCMQRARPRPSVKNNRMLPQPPSLQGAVGGAGNEEPIVFYEEDNEFVYKSDA